MTKLGLITKVKEGVQNIKSMYKNEIVVMLFTDFQES